jgi:hypothetical protein
LPQSETKYPPRLGEPDDTRGAEGTGRERIADQAIPRHVREAQRIADDASRAVREFHKRAGHPTLTERPVPVYRTPEIEIPTREPSDAELLGMRVQVSGRHPETGEMTVLRGTITHAGWWLHLGEGQHLIEVMLDDEGLAPVVVSYDELRFAEPE